jgi:hypothetical protein
MLTVVGMVSVQVAVEQEESDLILGHLLELLEEEVLENLA